jgi:hypothetical protein
MSRLSREKGKSGELELARKLRDEGFDARRGQQYSGASGDADVVGLPGIHIEVKRVEAFRLWDALAQSKSDARDGEIPIVVHRRSRCPWVVVVGLEDFLSIYRESDLMSDMASVEGGSIAKGKTNRKSAKESPGQNRG